MQVTHVAKTDVVPLSAIGASNAFLIRGDLCLVTNRTDGDGKIGVYRVTDGQTSFVSADLQVTKVRARVQWTDL